MSSATGREDVSNALMRAWPKAIPTATYFASRAGCTADDLIQEAWVIALEDPSRINLDYPANSFRAIVRNVGRNAVEKHRLRGVGADSAAIEDPASIVDASGRDASEAIAQRELSSVVREEIRNLPPAQQMILERQLEGASLAEVARASGRSEGGVSKENTRIQRRLRGSGKLRRLAEHLAVGPWFLSLRPRHMPGLKLLGAVLAVSVVVFVGAMLAVTSGENRGTDSLVPVGRTDGALSNGSAKTDRGPQPQKGSFALPTPPPAPHSPDSQDSSATPAGSAPGAVPARKPDTAPQSDGDVVSTIDPVTGQVTEIHTKRFPDGTPYLVWTTVNGIREGLQVTYRPDATVFKTEQFKAGKTHGYALYYAEDGVTLAMWILLDNGRIIDRSEEGSE